MLGVLPFVEDPDLSVSAARALAQHLSPCACSLAIRNIQSVYKISGSSHHGVLLLLLPLVEVIDQVSSLQNS